MVFYSFSPLYQATVIERSWLTITTGYWTIIWQTTFSKPSRLVSRLCRHKCEYVLLIPGAFSDISLYISAPSFWLEVTELLSIPTSSSVNPMGSPLNTRRCRSCKGRVAQYFPSKFLLLKFLTEVAPISLRLSCRNSTHLYLDLTTASHINKGRVQVSPISLRSRFSWPS